MHFSVLVTGAALGASVAATPINNEERQLLPEIEICDNLGETWCKESRPVMCVQTDENTGIVVANPEGMCASSNSVVKARQWTDYDPTCYNIGETWCFNGQRMECWDAGQYGGFRAYVGRCDEKVKPRQTPPVLPNIELCWNFDEAWCKGSTPVKCYEYAEGYGMVLFNPSGSCDAKIKARQIPPVWPDYEACSNVGEAWCEGSDPVHCIELNGPDHGIVGPNPSGSCGSPRVKPRQVLPPVLPDVDFEPCTNLNAVWCRDGSPVKCYPMSNGKGLVFPDPNGSC